MMAYLWSLFYLDLDRNPMAVEVKTSPGFEACPPQRLFPTRARGPYGSGQWRVKAVVAPRRAALPLPGSSASQ